MQNKKYRFVSNSNIREWCPIRSVIVRAFYQNRMTSSWSQICLTTSLISFKDRIGQHEVLLPAKFFYNFNLKTQCFSRFFSLDVRNNRIYSRATGLLMLKSELPTANQVEEFVIVTMADGFVKAIIVFSENEITLS